MSKRGPAPQPTRIKLLKGNPGHRPINKDEPQPTLAKSPKYPAYFGPIAKAEWKRIVPKLKELGLLTDIDVVALEVYCMTYSEYVQAEKVLEKKGRVYLALTRDGNSLKARPEVGISQKARHLMKAYLAEFGMTPSSRSKVVVSGNNDKDEGFDF